MKEKPLFYEEKKKPIGCLLIPLALLLVICATAFLSFVSVRYAKLYKQKVPVLTLDPKLEGLSLLHVSDLAGRRYGSAQRQMLDALKHISYQAVVMTGDMVGKKGDVRPVLEFLSGIPKDVPVYFIAGDDDPDALPLSDPLSPLAPWIQRLRQAGAVYVDRPIRHEANGRVLWFCPASLLTMDTDAARSALNERKTALLALPQPLPEPDQAALTAVLYQLQILDDCVRTEREMREEDAYIALSHYPLDNADVAMMQQETNDVVRLSFFPGRLSLVLSGHLNNGQLRLPLLGAVWAPVENGRGGWFPKDELLSGLSLLRGVPQYISPGLGCSSVYRFTPFRLFNPPAMTLLTLTRSFVPIR